MGKSAAVLVHLRPHLLGLEFPERSIVQLWFPFVVQEGNLALDLSRYRFVRIGRVRKVREQRLEDREVAQKLQRGLCRDGFEVSNLACYCLDVYQRRVMPLHLVVGFARPLKAFCPHGKKERQVGWSKL